MVAVFGVAHALKGAAQREGGHGERAALRCGRPFIHILHAARRCLCAGGIEVDLQVAHRLKGHAHLQVLCLVGRGRGGDRVAEQQPSAVTRLVHIRVACKAKGKVEAWRPRTLVALLPEGIAHAGHESRQRH